ncbi:MAG: DUF559 domain-containing protein [Mycobacteriales bacterium]
MPQQTLAAARSGLLDGLGAVQSGVVSRGQLRMLGIDRWQVRDHVRAGRWRALGSRVVVLHRGELTTVQWRWAAVLHAGSTAALARRSALEAAGLRGWPAGPVHVVVSRGVHVPELAGVVVHESRWVEDAHIDRVASPPRVRVEWAAIDAASAPEARTGCALLAAVVQQRLTTAARLHAALLAAPRAKNRRLLLSVLADIVGGSQALTEIDFARLCRAANLPPPERQVIRTDRYGRRRYLDAEWRLADGSALVVEIDGALHLQAMTYWDDMDRQNELVISGDRVLRFPSATLRLRPDHVVEQLRRALR